MRTQYIHLWRVRAIHIHPWTLWHSVGSAGMQCNMCHPDGELKIVLRFDLIACTVGRRRFHHVFLFFPFLLPLHVEGFQFLDQHYCLAAPPPTGRRAPPIPAALPKNKRESVRRHPLDLFHAPAPTLLPDGAAFFSMVSEPQESSKMNAPLPLSPLFSCPSSTCSLCHAPVPRARPLPRPTLAASSIQIVNHLLAMALLQDITFCSCKPSSSDM